MRSRKCCAAGWMVSACASWRNGRVWIARPRAAMSWPRKRPGWIVLRGSARPNGHGNAWEELLARQTQITTWVAGEGRDSPALSIVKIEERLARSGCVVPYRTLHRFAAERCGYHSRQVTVRINEGEPGAELQIDFGQMGFLTDAESGRRRKVHALIFTAAYSRHMYVWLSYSQTLAAVITGCEAAWVFFGGVFKVIIPEYVPWNIFGVLWPGAPTGRLSAQVSRSYVGIPCHITVGWGRGGYFNLSDEKGSCHVGGIFC